MQAGSVDVRGASVEAQGLGKRYATTTKDVVALSDVSFALEPGALVAVMGPSGSGKSTLLHMIGAMDSPDDGQVRVGDVHVTSLSAGEQPGFRRRIGFVFQRFHLLPGLTALDNVVAPLLPYRVDFDKHARALELLDAVGLGGRADAIPTELSGGEQQRVAIARALINDPILLLADEPTGNLDSHTGAEIVDLIVSLRDAHGMTVIVATHDVVVASACERIIRLQDGRVVEELSVSSDVDPQQVLERIGRLDAFL